LPPRLPRLPAGDGPSPRGREAPESWSVIGEPTRPPPLEQRESARPYQIQLSTSSCAFRAIFYSTPGHPQGARRHPAPPPRLRATWRSSGAPVHRSPETWPGTGPSDPARIRGRRFCAHRPPCIGGCARSNEQICPKSILAGAACRQVGLGRPTRSAAELESASVRPPPAELFVNRQRNAVPARCNMMSGWWFASLGPPPATAVERNSISPGEVSPNFPPLHYLVALTPPLASETRCRAICSSFTVYPYRLLPGESWSLVFPRPPICSSSASASATGFYRRHANECELPARRRLQLPARHESTWRGRDFSARADRRPRVAASVTERRRGLSYTLERGAPGRLEPDLIVTQACAKSRGVPLTTWSPLRTME